MQETGADVSSLASPRDGRRSCPPMHTCLHRRPAMDCTSLLHHQTGAQDLHTWCTAPVYCTTSTARTPLHCLTMRHSTATCSAISVPRSLVEQVPRSPSSPHPRNWRRRGTAGVAGGHGGGEICATVHLKRGRNPCIVASTRRESVAYEGPSSVAYEGPSSVATRPPCLSLTLYEGPFRKRLRRGSEIRTCLRSAANSRLAASSLHMWASSAARSVSATSPATVSPCSRPRRRSRCLRARPPPPQTFGSKRERGVGGNEEWEGERSGRERGVGGRGAWRQAIERTDRKTDRKIVKKES